MIKPLLAAKCPPDMTMDQFLTELKFPLGATPKIDGIRCMTLRDVDGRSWAASRTLKPIPNRHIQQCLSSLPPFLDGELTVGKNFQAATSGIMSHDGQPDFTYWVFGCKINEPERTYGNVADLLEAMVGTLPSFVKVLSPVTINSLDQLADLESAYLSEGAEGVMLRDFTRGYKYGRSTLREQRLDAIKRFEDSEAIVDDFEEL